MVGFILDTCTVSELNKASPNFGVQHWFDATPTARIFVSVITVGELQRGVELLPNSRRRDALVSWVATFRKTYADRLVGIDEQIALAWGRFSAMRKSAGRPLPTTDGLIAASAAVRDMMVVTRNDADFAGLDIGVLNPWSS